MVSDLQDILAERVREARRSAPQASVARYTRMPKKVSERLGRLFEQGFAQRYGTTHTNTLEKAGSWIMKNKELLGAIDKALRDGFIRDDGTHFSLTDSGIRLGLTIGYSFNLSDYYFLRYFERNPYTEVKLANPDNDRFELRDWCYDNDVGIHFHGRKYSMRSFTSIQVEERSRVKFQLKWG